jgi:carbon monoxide dehydrogenase subunit G
VLAGPNCEHAGGAKVFRIKAEYTEQLELNTSIERAREFFGELRNFVELMPGIESIKAEAAGAVRWIVRTDVPVIGAMRAVFAVELTEDSPDRVEWSPATFERKNYLRYAANFVERSASKTLVRITQHVELRRQQAKELHMLAGLVGESRISAEMQKQVADMIRVFLRRAQERLETQNATT